MSKKSPLVRDSMTILADRYDAVELLSDQGGMGVVYRCTRDNKVTVVKCIKPALP